MAASAVTIIEPQVRLVNSSLFPRQTKSFRFCGSQRPRCHFPLIRLHQHRITRLYASPRHKYVCFRRLFYKNIQYESSRKPCLWRCLAQCLSPVRVQGYRSVASNPQQNTQTDENMFF